MKRINFSVKLIILLLSSLMVIKISNISADTFSLPKLYSRIVKILCQPNEKETMVNRIVPNRGFHLGGVHVDCSTTPNRIYVLDSGNNRILGFLGYKGPDGAADIVIGQLEKFDMGTANGDNTKYMLPTASTLAFQPYPFVVSTSESPRSGQMATDQEGSLYVVDNDNNRVLKYTDPFGTDQIADEVWGQEDFTHRDANRGQARPSNNTLWTGWTGQVFSSGVDVDNYGNLWIADTRNNRVLRFPQGAKTADLVLGQSDFNRNSCTIWFTKPLNKMSKPNAVRVHPLTGEVYVLEDEWPGLARVLVFTPPFSNGMFASRVIGRAQYQNHAPTEPYNHNNWQSFDTNGDEIHDTWVNVVTGLNWSRGFCFDPSGTGDIWVNDGGNRRAILFDRQSNMIDVINQPDFNTRVLGMQSGYIYDGMRRAFDQNDGGIGTDRDGNLYISSTAGSSCFSRNVMRFETPLRRSALGNFTYVVSSGAMLHSGWNQYSARTVNSPFGMALTAGSQLFLSDGQRILVWNDYRNKATFSEADFIIGQDRGDENFNDEGIFAGDRIKYIIAVGNYIFVSANYKIYIFGLPVTSGGRNYQPIKKLESEKNVYWKDDGNLVHFQPIGLAYDVTEDALWVSDADGYRVLRIKNPLGNAKVDIVLGQPNKTSLTPNAGQTGPNRVGFAKMWSLALDRFRNLYVLDSGHEWGGNKRILRFDAEDIIPLSSTIFPLPEASGVFCKDSFYNANDPEDPHLPKVPIGIDFDSQNHMVLSVCSYGNLQYEKIFYYATPHIGQMPQPTAIIDIPLGQGGVMCFDTDYNLIIQDHSWYRILFVALDSTPPSAPVVTDEGEFTRENQLYASWTSSDPESDIQEYQYTIIQDSIRGAVIRDWTSTGRNGYVTAGPLNLIKGRTYYFGVKAKNGSGLWSWIDYSDGITVDTLPPQGALKINNDAIYTNSTSVTLTISAIDTGSGMGQGAQMRFSNHDATWTNPEAYSGTKSWTLLPGDGKKIVYVMFKDVIGNWSKAVSDMIILDTSKPIKPIVTDDGVYTNSLTTLHASWSSSDPESGIGEYQYRITSDSQNTKVVRDWTFAGTNTSIVATGLRLTYGKQYYFFVKAKNGIGLWSDAGRSDGIIVDIIAPVMTNVTTSLQLKNKPVLFQAWVSDNLSGVNSVSITIDSIATLTMNYNLKTKLYEAVFDFTSTKKVIVSYYISAKDNAGNKINRGPYYLALRYK